MNLLRATLRKEIREALRDRRALFLTLIMPLLFYPAMLGLTGWLQHDQLKKEAVKVLRVGVFNENSVLQLPDTEGMKWIKVENLDRIRAFPLFIHIKQKSNNQFPIQLYFYDTAQGDIARSRVDSVLREIEDELIRAELDNLELAPSFLEPLRVERINQASTRESVGSRWGGVGAYFLVFLSFTGCLSVSIDTGAGEKDRGTLEAMLVTPASLYQIAAGKLLYIMVMGMLSVCATVAGISGLVLISSSISGIGNINFDVISVLSSIGLLISVIALFASLLLGLSLLSKSSKEAHMRGSLLLLVVAVALVYSTLPGIEYTTSLSFVPVLNIAMALRAVVEGNLTVSQWCFSVGFMALLTILSLLYTSYSIRKNPESALLKD